jgi:hypothetical protein
VIPFSDKKDMNNLQRSRMPHLGVKQKGKERKKRRLELTSGILNPLCETLVYPR